jgi:hypothetical protein
MKNPLSQERKSCSPIALPFDELQLGHMPFDHAITPLPGETVSHRVFVFLNASSKGLELGKLAIWFSQASRHSPVRVRSVWANC